MIHLCLLLLGCSFGLTLESGIHDHVFKEYDLRGKVGIDFNPDDFYELGRAIGTYFSTQEKPVQRIALGMDGRTHSKALKESLSKALIDQGFDVTFIGTCTTPVLYFVLNTMNLDAGLMITASHNPAEYNGVKIMQGTECVFGPSIKTIQNIYTSRAFKELKAGGSYVEIDAITSYVDWLASKFSHLKGSKLSVIFDCGNGAAGTVLPQLIEKMDWKHMGLLYGDVDGTYPHHIADPTVDAYVKDLKAEVATRNAALGIAFDGDCDRMAPVTKSGTLIAGDRLLALFSKPLIEKNPGASIVFDVAASTGLIDLITQWGGNPIMSRTGHAHIKAAMKKHNALLAGEISCHFMFKDRYFGYDDGIYAALRLIELLEETHKPLEELLMVFPTRATSPTYRLHCPYEKRDAVLKMLKENLAEKPDTEVLLMDGIRVNFAQGWALVRPSNTEEMLSMRFEGNSKECLESIQHDFAHLLDGHIDCPFKKASGEHGKSTF